MSAIPYSLSGRFSAELLWPNKFYWSAFDVLIHSNGLQIVLNILWKEGDDFESEMGFKLETAYFVLKHIIYRTLQFDKTFEFIRHADVIKGMPCNAIAGCCLSPASVKRVLSRLSPPQNDYLLKLRFVHNGTRIITPLYGLNLPAFLKLTTAWWQAEIDTDEVSKDTSEYRPNRKPSNLMLRGRCMLKHCVEFSENWQDAFDFLVKCSKPISDVEDFIKKWSKHFPTPRKRGTLVSDFEHNIADCRKMKQLRKDYLEEIEE